MPRSRARAIIGKWAVFVHFSLFMLANDGKSVTINNFDGGGGVDDGNHDGSAAVSKKTRKTNGKLCKQILRFRVFSRLKNLPFEHSIFGAPGSESNVWVYVWMGDCGDRTLEFEFEWYNLHGCVFRLRFSTDIYSLIHCYCFPSQRTSTVDFFQIISKQYSTIERIFKRGAIEAHEHEFQWIHSAHMHINAYGNASTLNRIDRGSIEQLELCVNTCGTNSRVSMEMCANFTIR